jgi:ribosome-binding factor A
MSTHSRPDRVAQMIQQQLGQIFARGGMKDPRLGLVTITGCKISPDLRQARVFWTVHGDEKVRADTKKGLEAARGFLRREIGQEMSLRVVPDLSFTYDEAIDRGDRIEQLLREAKEGDQRRAQEAAALAGADSSGEGDE